MTELEQLRAENARLKASMTAGAQISLGNKGGVSVKYGPTWPVTLEPDQWATIFAMREQVEAFIAENKSEIAKRKASPIVKDTAKAGLGKVS